VLYAWSTFSCVSSDCVISRDTLPRDSVFRDDNPWVKMDDKWKYDTIDPFYDLIDVEALIDISSRHDIARKQKELLRYIWKKTGSLPNNLPDAIEKDIEDDIFKDFRHIASVDKLVINMDYGINSIAYLFHPMEAKDTLFIYHQGHGGHFDMGKVAIETFLENGYPVLAFNMPLEGYNSRPIVQLKRFGPIKLVRHNDLKYLEEPMKYFFEPIARSLNYMEQEYSFKRIAMTGISGGGWTTTLYPAIDSRVQRSYPVAGTYPIAIRANVPSEVGDFEQNDPGLYRIANYYELYVMAGYGKNRKQIQIINRYDNDWISGIRLSGQLSQGSAPAGHDECACLFHPACT